MSSILTLCQYQYLTCSLLKLIEQGNKNYQPDQKATGFNGDGQGDKKTVVDDCYSSKNGT